MAINRGNPKNIGVHHSAVNPPAMNMADLKARASSHNNYHRANSVAWNNTTHGEFGYNWIRYHYIIAQDGSVLQTQHEKYALYANSDGTGVNSFNYNAVNIMVEGNYEIAHPTEAMKLALVKLIRDIQNRYKINPMVRGHKQLSQTGTACPGKHIGTSTTGWLKEAIDAVNNPNYPAPADWRTQAIKFPQTITYITNKATALFEINTGARMSEFAQGQKIDVSYEYQDYLITAWSYDRQVKNGFKKADLDPYVQTPPPVEPPPVQPPVVVPPPAQCEAEKKQIKILEEDILELKIGKAKAESIVLELEKELDVVGDEFLKQEKAMLELEKKVENQKVEIGRKNDQITELKHQVDTQLDGMGLKEFVRRIGLWLRGGG